MERKKKKSQNKQHNKTKQKTTLFTTQVTILLIIAIALTGQGTGKTNTDTYTVGEATKIDLQDIGRYTAEITTPKGTYLQRNENTQLYLTFEEQGNYTITITPEDKNKQKQTYTFNVKNADNEKETTVINKTNITPILNNESAIYEDIDEIEQENVTIPEIIQERDILKIKDDKRIEIGKNVTWTRKTYVTETKDLLIEIPEDSQNITIKGEQEKTIEHKIKSGIKQTTNNLFSDAPNKTLTLQNVQGSIEITYTTPAPNTKEETINDTNKKITISTDKEYGYKNILAHTTIPEKIPVGKENLIDLTWKTKGDKNIGFEAYDTNNNSLLDRIEWNVEHLSEQEYEISLNILDVQSYPLTGNNWTVRFETLGTANLTIEATNGTTWSNTEGEDVDLIFKGIKCGETHVNYTWNGNVNIENYSCNDTSYEISKVRTQRVHVLEFTYGEETGTAQNYAFDADDNLTQIYNATPTQQLPLTTVVATDLSQETIVDTGYTHYATQPTRLYINSTDLYKISYGCTIDNFDAGHRSISESWVRKNGTHELVPSKTGCYTRTSGTDADRCSNQATFIANLSNGEYIELVHEQIKQQNTGSEQVDNDCWMYVQRARRPLAQQYDGTGGQTYALGSNTKINLDTSTWTDSRAFTADTANDEIDITTDAWYKLYYHACADNGPQTNRHNARLFARIGTTAITPSNVHSYLRDNSNGDINCEQGVLLYNLSDGDDINLQITKAVAEAATGSTLLINQSWLLIEQVPFSDTFMAYVNNSDQLLSNGVAEVINLSRAYKTAPEYTFTNNASRIQFNESGLYEIGYVFGWDDGAPGNDRNVVCSRLLLNSTAVQPSQQCDYSRGDPNGARYGSTAANIIVNISAGDYLEMQAIPTGRDVNVFADATWISVIPLNTFIDTTPPQYIIGSIVTNNSNPDPNQMVLFESNWTDTTEMDSFEFFWDLGSGFEPAGTGSLTGFNDTASINKSIPQSMEGQQLFYYFRATDLDGFSNQTTGTDFVTVNDTTPPAINFQNINESQTDYGSVIRIDANITDAIALVNASWAQIERPVSGYENISMTNITNHNWTVNYTTNEVGRYNITIWANDSSGNEGNGSLLTFNITGYSNVNLTNPTGGSYGYGESLPIYCNVTDANTSIGIVNYNVDFYAGGGFIGTNTTNSSGVAYYNWTVEGEGPTGLDCVINNSASLHYNTVTNVSTTQITITTPQILVNNTTHENKELNVAQWHNTNWQRRKPITINANLQASKQNFPVLINITDIDLRDDAQTDGDDILFTTADGTTQLDHEIERYNNTNGHLTAWVEVNLSAHSSNTIYMYYNNSAATSQQDQTGTWNSDYGMVYHMNSTGLDSTSNNNDLVSTSGAPIQTEDYLGTGMFYDGVDDDWDLTNLVYWEQEWFVRTHEVVFDAEGDINTRQVLLGEGGGTNGVMMYILNGYLYARWWSEGTPAWYGDHINTSISTNTKYHAIMGLMEGSNRDDYFLMVNGQLIDSRTATDHMDAHSGNGAIAETGGNTKDFHDLNGSAGHPFNGTIYEFRTMDVERTNEWYSTSYQSMLNTSFISVGSEQNESNHPTINLDEYETLDNMSFVNVTVRNNGSATATNTNISLTLLYPNGSQAFWFPEHQQSCGTMTAASTCEVQFNNNTYGYYLDTLIGGLYQFNITNNWSGGGNNPTNNQTPILIHHIPNNITGSLTDAEITSGGNTTYAVSITNPWSDTLTNVNISLNCPIQLGLFCSALSDNNLQYEYLGDIYIGQTHNFEFNISSNDSLAIGSYNINITVSYTNPTGDNKTWTQINNDELTVRPLLSQITTTHTDITRGDNINLEGYAKNIGTENLTGVSYNWTLPTNWANNTGNLNGIQAQLESDEVYWGNITAATYQNVSIGNQTITLDVDSPNATQDSDTLIISVYANTNITPISVNNTNPLRGETITITARLLYDNGTAIPNQDLTFQNNATNRTNSTGHAQIKYVIPLNASTGTNNFTINIIYNENNSAYLRANNNNTTITVNDEITITQDHNPNAVGYGQNVTINATVTSTNNISSVYANVTSPTGTNHFTNMTNITANTFEINFSNLWEQGTWNYTIWANNTQGFENETTTTGQFNVGANISVTLDTLESFYIANEQVNLTHGEPISTDLTTKSDHGQIILASTSSDTASLAYTFDLNKSFIVADSQIWSSNSANADRAIGRTYFSSITNGRSNELTAERGSTTDTMIASYSVIQSDNINACHLSHTMAAADGQDYVDLSGCDNSIPSNHMQKCFVSTKHNVEATVTTSGCAEEQRVMANITNTTHLELQRSSVSCGSSVVEAQVVCFTDETTVTRIHVPSAQYSTGVFEPIGSSVNLSNSWMIYSYQSDGNGIEQANVECYFENSSYLRCRTSSLGSTETSSQEAVAHVIEFASSQGSTVQQHTPSTAEIGDNIQFTTTLSTAVNNLSQTLGFCVSSFRSGEGTAYPRGAYPCAMTDSSTFNCTRGRTGNTNPSNDMHCQAIEWPETYDTPLAISNIFNSGNSNSLFYYLMTIETNNSGSWLYADTVLNDTATSTIRSINSLVTENISDEWNVEGGGWDTGDAVGGGYYRARVSLVDPQGNYLENGDGSNMTNTAPFEIDFTPPTVILDYPPNASTQFGLSITVNYTASDPSGVVNCSIFHNQSGLFTLEETKTYSGSSENNFTISGFTNNTRIDWNVRCTDGAGNTGFTAETEWFLQIVPPDFTINNTEIYLENTTTIIEGTNVTINATIWNIGGQDGITNVSFYDGHPNESGILIGNSTVFVAVGSINYTQVNWSAEIGPHNIHVLIDPPLEQIGQVEEINESNNLGNRSFNIPSWQEFYGNASIEIFLARTGLAEINAWGNDTILDGNVFIADQEANIEWLEVHALGRNDSGTTSSQDFQEFDTSIGTENYSDSISNEYTTAQIPDNTENFTISGRTVNYVPIINSTNNSNFTTGILWDDNDDTNGEYDNTEEEDIIFVNKMNKQQTGRYGIYDYEINIPVRLRSYDTGNEQNVYLYFELN